MTGDSRAGAWQIAPESHPSMNLWNRLLRRSAAQGSFHCECGSCTDLYPPSEMVTRYTGNADHPTETLHKSCYESLYGPLKKPRIT